jgi:hypothetical protein
MPLGIPAIKAKLLETKRVFKLHEAYSRLLEATETLHRTEKTIRDLEFEIATLENNQ